MAISNEWSSTFQNLISFTYSPSKTYIYCRTCIRPKRVLHREKPVPSCSKAQKNEGKKYEWRSFKENAWWVLDQWSGQKSPRIKKTTRTCAKQDIPANSEICCTANSKFCWAAVKSQKCWNGLDGRFSIGNRLLRWSLSKSAGPGDSAWVDLLILHQVFPGLETVSSKPVRTATLEGSQDPWHSKAPALYYINNS